MPRRLLLALAALALLESAGAAAQSTEAAAACKAEVLRLQEAKDLAGARERAAACVAELLALPAAERTPALTDRLNELGLLAYKLGDLRAARDAWRAVVAERAARLPEDAAALLGARLNLGNALRNLGDLAGARALHADVLRIREGTLDKDHADVQRARSALASTLDDAGDLRAALALRETVLEVAERTLAVGHAELRKARANVAVSAKRLGDRARARALEEQVLAALEGQVPEDDLGLQGARLNLAISLHHYGDYEGARALEQGVLAVFDRALPDDHPDLQMARGSLAATLYVMGELERARALFERVLAVQERTLPESHPSLQAARMNLSVAIRDLGDFDGARSVLERAQANYEATLSPDHPELLRVRGNLALTLWGQRKLVEARELLEGILEVQERTLPPDHPELRATLMNLGGVLSEMGELDAARELHEASLAASESALPPGHPEVLRARGGLGVTLEAQGELEAALEVDRATLEGFARLLPDDHPDIRMARRSLVRVLARLGRAEELAAEHAKLVAGLQVWLQAGAGESPRAAATRVGSVGTQLGLALSLVPRGSPLEAQLFAALETARDLCSGALTLRGALPAELEPLRREAQASRQRINDLVSARGGPAPGSAATSADRAQTSRDELARLARQRDDAEGRLRAALRERGLLPPFVEAAALAKTLPEGGYVVACRCYTRTVFVPGSSATPTSEFHLLAFVLDRQGALTRVELGPVLDIDAAVGRWRAAVGKPVERGRALAPEGAQTAQAAERAAGLELSALVLDPILAACGGARELFLCLDAALHLVPLDALPRGEGRVGDTLRVHVLPSLATRLQARPAPAGEPSFLALGGADFNASAGQGSSPLGTAWAPIAETRAEAANLGELFRETFEREPIVLSGKQATKSELLAHTQGVRFLHVATHGYFAAAQVRNLAEPPTLAGGLRGPDPFEAEEWAAADLRARAQGLAPLALCGLALAGANRGADALGHVPGILSAEELAGTDLGGCALAVLSACETNVGIARAGQGIRSLQGALHAAGARHAITSLWRVDDAQTRRLFEDFYTRIWVHGEAHGPALWQAKMALCASGAPTRDWAGWVLSGADD